MLQISASVLKTNLTLVMASDKLFSPQGEALLEINTADKHIQNIKWRLKLLLASFQGILGLQEDTPGIPL